MNIKEYNKEKGKNASRGKTDIPEDNVYHNRNKSKKKKIRLDKLIAYITIIVILIFSGIIYSDFKSATKPKSGIVSAADMKDEIMTVASTTSTTSAVQSNNKVICIDAGHGGTDGGAQSGNYLEKDQTLEMAKLVQNILQSKGYQVVMTRTADDVVSLEKRLEIAKKANAGIIVSIHRNFYNSSSSVNGVEAWINSTTPSDAKSLADDILTQLEKNCNIKNRGVKSGTIENPKTNYYLNSNSPCTSCIIELGFITNATDNTLVTKNKNQCANSIAQGIMNYINDLEKKNVTN